VSVNHGKARRAGIYESVDLVELENYQPIDDFSNVKSDMPHFEVIPVIRLK